MWWRALSRIKLLLALGLATIGLALGSEIAWILLLLLPLSLSILHAMSSGAWLAAGRYGRLAGLLLFEMLLGLFLAFVIYGAAAAGLILTLLALEPVSLSIAPLPAAAVAAGYGLAAAAGLVAIVRSRRGKVCVQSGIGLSGGGAE